MCKLKKALHGLKQSPRAWFGCYTRATIDLEYHQSRGDHALFIKHGRNGGAVTILSVYVDDILITGGDIEEIRKLA